MNLRKLLHWFRQIVFWLLWPALALVIWGELTPQQLPEGLETYWDKLLHFTAYFGLSLMATIAVRADRRTLWWAMALMALGGALEIIQAQVGRDGDWHDELANTLGVLAGWGVAAAGIAILRARKLVEGAKQE